MSRKVYSQYYAWWVTIIGTITSLTVFSTMTSYSMTVSQLAAALGTTPHAVMLGETIRMVFCVIGMVLGGVAISKIGVKSTVALAMACLLIPQFLIPYIKSYNLLIVLKIVQGFASMTWTALVVSIMSWIKGKQIGLASGIFLGGSLAGGGIGGVIVGYVIPSMGWQASFWVLGIISLTTTIVWYSTVKVAPTSEKLEDIAESGEALSPFKTMIKMPETWLLSLIMLGSTWMLFGLLSSFPIYGKHIGYNVTKVGNLTTAISVGYIVAALIGGVVSDSMANRMGQLKGRSVAMAIGFAIAVAGAFLLPILAPMSFGLFYLIALISAFGNSWPQAVFWAVPHIVYPPNIEAAGTGFTGGVGNISDPISPLLIGVILGGSGLWKIGWWTCALASAVALIASLILAARDKSMSSSTIR